MGAFFLFRKEILFDQKSVDQVFEEQGFDPPTKFEISDYILHLFKKILVLENNYHFLDKDNAIFSTGTLIYKSLTPAQSLKQLIIDLKNNKFCDQELIGQFTVLVIIDGELKLLPDRACVNNVYYNKQKTMFSSSFLAVSMAVSDSLTINKNSFTEVLLTGGLIGPETIFNEILRLEPVLLESDFKPKLIKLKLPEYNLDRQKNINTLIVEQLDRLDAYFNSISKLADQYGSLIGLTGGFDSRLLMCFAEQHFKKINYFSYGRKIKNIEIEVAEKLVNVVNKKLNLTKFSEPFQMTEDEAYNTLDKGFYHFDGHIRTQCYWHEEYNTLAYTKSLYDSSFLGFHGVGGEQYRNYERMIKPYWYFNSWLKHELIYRYSSNIFLNKTDEKKFVNYFKEKIEKKLSIKAPKFINHLFVKRYYNEIHNISNRTTRSTIENKAVYFLSPFVDPLISYKAYEIIPKMGSSLDFQSLMIKKINPALAKIDSNYGFNFFNGESLSSSMKGYLKELAPRSLFFKVYHHNKKSKQDDFYNNYKNMFTFVKESENYIKQLNLNIDLEKLKYIRDTGWLLIAAGHFLKKFNDKIRL